jgi:hypothetical protein
MEPIARMLKGKRRTVSFLFATAVVALLVGDELASPVISQFLRRDSPYAEVEAVQEDATPMHVPATLDLPSQRTLSLNLGGGNCKWQPPVYAVPNDIDFYKTVIAGFPSGDKRMIFIQMEALTGWPAKDEWDFGTSPTVLCSLFTFYTHTHISFLF